VADVVGLAGTAHPSRRRPRPLWSARRREALTGYLFLAPWAAGFAIFIAGPTLVSAFLSLTRYDILRPPLFVGLDNYWRAAFNDPQFWASLGRTGYFALLMVPAALTIALGLALLLNRRTPGVALFRAAYFLPHLVPIAAAAVIWLWILDPRFGPLNALLGWLGIPGPGWLTSTSWAIPGIALIALWMAAGGNAMIIFLAALQGVPRELTEAATIDGAGAWQRFRHVTLPMISPALFFNLILAIIAALKVFTIPLVATEGGPAYATYFYALHIYMQAFQFFNMGYAAALAWVLLVIVMILTLIQFRLRRRWVHFEGDDD
jgi:multiple sugar transport system permease protein